MSRILFLFLLFIGISDIHGQSDNIRDNSFDYYLELVTEQGVGLDDDLSSEELANRLYDLWVNPLNINTQNTYELLRLFWLNEFQMNQLMNYVEHHQPVLSIYELKYLPGFDSTLVNSLKPFIRTEGTGLMKKREVLSGRVLYRMGRTLELQKGFREGDFEGSPWKYNLKYQMEYGDQLQAGFNLEKDAGEALFRGSNRLGPDYYSGYVRLNEIGKIKTLCLGNYSLGFGQGLVTGPGFALGKSSQAVNLVQKESGIRQFTSDDENHYLQGVAATCRVDTWEFTGFYSLKKIDANITLKDETGKVKEVSTLQTGGIHATLTEIEDEDVLREVTLGGRVALKKSWLNAGFTYIHTGFNASIIPENTDYNQFYFRGDKQDNLGFDYKLNYRNTTFFGEEATDLKGNPAIINGITSNIAGRIQFTLLHRYYSPKYHSFYGNGFGENSHVQNEEGLYAGFTLPLVKHLQLSVYSDFYRFPWLKYRVDGSSYGRDMLAELEYSPNNVFAIKIQYHGKSKQVNQTDSDDYYYELADASIRRFRINGAYNINENLRLNTRLETSRYQAGDSLTCFGYLLYQDIFYHGQAFPVQIGLRYALFDIPDYNARIYAYESDVLYAFSMNAYYKQGQRYALLIKYSPGSNFDFWLKFGQTIYQGEKVTGSGLYEAQGNKKTELKLQMICKF